MITESHATTGERRSYPRLALLGWSLWVISMVVPDADLECVGACTFVTVPMLAGSMLLQANNLIAAGIGLALLIGFAANLSIFLWLPRWASFASIAAPLVPFAADLAISAPNYKNVLGLLYFYPWAAGIIVLHIARLLTRPFPKPKGAAQPERQATEDANAV